MVKLTSWSTSQGSSTAADVSLGIIYRTIWGRLEDVWTFFGDVFRTSLGRNEKFKQH